MKIIKQNKFLIVLIIFLIVSIIYISKNFLNYNLVQGPSLQGKFWEMQSVDTVKYSRDLAGQYLNDSSFDKTIEDQVKKIADTGATHIALGAPYDERFIPFLKRWVYISRKNGLKIWFRGNFSGWEGWFDYKSITREEHKKLLAEFIKNNGDLFEDGDYFSSCTECENGGAGDPRQNGDVNGHRQFLIDEYQIAKNNFRAVGKNVYCNLFPMNYDVANLVMDKDTTTALGGIVTIDHYVGTPERTNNDANILAEKSGGKIIIGEFGAPIPDIHGDMTQEEQANWIYNAFSLLYKNKNIIGVNYWTGFGGSTKLWNDDGTNRLAVSVIKDFYSPKLIKGYVLNDIGKPIDNVKITTQTSEFTTNKFGQFTIPILLSDNLYFSKDGYHQQYVTNLTYGKTVKITLKKIDSTFTYNLQKLIYNVIISL